MTTLERKENTIFGYLQRMALKKRFIKQFRKKKDYTNSTFKKISMLEQQIQTK